MLLQTLSTRDFDELVGAFPRWDLRFRQLGRGPFRGRLQLLQLQAAQVFRLSVRRAKAKCGSFAEPPRQTNPHAAGIDIHSDVYWVSVPLEPYRHLPITRKTCPPSPPRRSEDVSSDRTGVTSRRIVAAIGPEKCVQPPQGGL